MAYWVGRRGGGVTPTSALIVLHRVGRKRQSIAKGDIVSNYDLQEDQKVVEITVRDRRQVHQFSIHNLVVDEWLPIITIWGLGLYTFFVRLANRRDERSFPGYRLIQRHLKMSPTTISHYNKLLVWCGLVHIEPGDRVNSNDYYILDIPKVTPEKLAEIRQQAIEHFPPGNKFLKALLKRLDKWQPVQALWDAGSDKRTVVVHKAQLALPLDEGVDGATPDKQGTTPDKQGATPNKEGATPNKEGAPPGVAEQSETTIRNNNPNNNNMMMMLVCQNLGGWLCWWNWRRRSASRWTWT